MPKIALSHWLIFRVITPFDGMVLEVSILSGTIANAMAGRDVRNYILDAQQEVFAEAQATATGYSTMELAQRATYSPTRSLQI